jgi:two-component system sensor histidine kinase ChvG
MRLGLRAQLLIVSSLLLALPFLGLRSAREIEAFLIETQEQGLAATARAVAVALNERPAIFLAKTPPNPDPAGTLGARGSADAAPQIWIKTLARPVTIDGKDDDWVGQPSDLREIEAAVSPVASSDPSSAAVPGAATTPLPPSPPLRLRYRIGSFERSIYALIDVRDDVVVRHDSDFPRVAASDHVEVAMVSVDDEFLRFVIQEAGDGAARISLIDASATETPDTRIEAIFVETDDGYRIELRIPRTLVGARLGLAVSDVDDRESRLPIGRIATSGTTLRDEIGFVFVPSPEAAALVQGLGRARSRLWVLDARSQVLAQAGSLQGGRVPQPPPTWRQKLVMALRPIYGSILTEPTEDFTDHGPDATELKEPEITRALRGESTRWRRRTSDGRAVVLSAAEPVWIDNSVVGVVLAEETTNETLAARNRAFERLFFSIAFVVFAGALTLLLFATRLSFRIHALRDGVEQAIDRHGRVKGEIPPSNAQDEIGDLSRSFGSLLERQRQYTAYLEDLRGRLSHEIRTPVAVVRSSLDNLRLQNLPEKAAVYLDRADEGLSRLVTIVQRMTEASRLEQTLAKSDREEFDLVRVVSGCVEGYRLANAAREIAFHCDAPKGSLVVDGAPDLVAQLLDKLVENALDFARPGTPVEVRLTRGLGIGFLAVSNEGPDLSDDVAGRLFESVVSSRPSDGTGRIHLGLGLTIVRAIADFHNATVNAMNRRDVQGVTFTVAFPLQTRA